MSKVDRAEEHYLDALEAMDDGDIEGAKSCARKATKSDSQHAEAWWLISGLELPKDNPPNLIQASRSLSACRKAIALEPSNNDAWVRGGQLLADELGMYEEALIWWQNRRELVPYDPVAVIEQSALLADMGLYGKASVHLKQIFDLDLEVSPKQYQRIARLHSTMSKAAEQDPIEHFKPWEKRHPGWSMIEFRKNKNPVSESLIFLLVTSPFLVMEMWLANSLNNAGFFGFCLTSLVVLFTVMTGMRFSRKLFHRVNKPAFDLVRAQDIETTSGCVVIPEEIRTSKMYMSILSRRTKAFQERTLSIVDEGRVLAKGWTPSIPNLEVEIIDSEENIDEDDIDVPGFEEE
ncbi:MAG: tetratricopeptide repeat protein [Euryarchaeota archaeon]|jgi:hypothetical protein|nr:tetratricopeptide repeat protein [Euryarchaeota archaeon]